MEVGDCCFFYNYEATGCNGEECRDGGWIGNDRCDPFDCQNWSVGCSDPGGGGGGGPLPQWHEDTMTVDVGTESGEELGAAYEPVNDQGFYLGQRTSIRRR